MKNWFLSLPFILPLGAQAQLADGSTAPDFTLTDINGQTHHLYDYLGAGKTVIIDFFCCPLPHLLVVPQYTRGKGFLQRPRAQRNHFARCNGYSH